MFNIFKSKREKQFEELCKLYKFQIDELKKRPEHVAVTVPDPTQQAEYWRQLATLETNDFLLYHFTQMKSKIMMAFAIHGKDYGEYYRGKMDCIRDILTDARNAGMGHAQLLKVEAAKQEKAQANKEKAANNAL